MKILSVVSTRPELIKMAPLMTEIERRGIEHIMVATGQHYEVSMFDNFLAELGLNAPKENFKLASGSQAFQTGAALQEMERMVKKYSPDLVLAEGDTNSILAAAVASQKLLVPFGHVEAGLRSFDRTMPEEINRIVCDHCAELLFAPTELSALQLLLEKVPKKKVFITGNTVVDACLEHLKIARSKSKILEQIGWNDFVLFTCHRQENTTPEKLKLMCDVLCQMKYNIVFPMHPRTQKLLKEAGLFEKISGLKNLKIMPPAGYLDFLLLIDSSRAIVTDSGGVQEEAYVMGKKCIVLRENTERPESLSGDSVLTGLNPALILESLEAPSTGKSGNAFGTGNAAKKIVDVIELKYSEGSLKVEASNFIGRKYPLYRLITLRNDAPSFIGKTINEFEKQKGSVNLLFDNGTAVYPVGERSLKAEDCLLVVT